MGRRKPWATLEREIMDAEETARSFADILAALVIAGFAVETRWSCCIFSKGHVVLKLWKSCIGGVLMCNGTAKNYLRIPGGVLAERAIALSNR
jgi:hypothetical protein